MKLKKFSTIIIVFALIIAGLSFISPVFAEEVDPAEEIITDADCVRAVFTGEAIDPETNKPYCNTLCQKQILNDPPDYITKNGRFCEFGSTSEQGETPDGKAYLPDAKYPIAASQDDSILIYIRGAIYAVMGISGLAVILMGLYGWYLRSMSEGNPDKVEEVMKVYKNAIIGTIIVFMAVVIMQIFFTIMGITESIFDFNFIPKYGYVVNVKEMDIGRYCFENQIDKDGEFSCVDNKWVK